MIERCYIAIERNSQVWGEERVPRYHTQFIAISGIAEFKCADPADLPTTTTKRGVDGSSIAYLQAKNKMREGMKLFTDYTNRWKGRAEQTKQQFEGGIPHSFTEIKSKATSVAFSQTRRSIPGAIQYKPPLPKPERLSPRRRRIAYTKSIDDVAVVGEYLFGDSEANASDVGEKCFDLMLREASN